MNKSRILGYALSALAVTWIVSGASVSAQMPLMLDEILLSESGNTDAAAIGTEVAVDGSGRWLTLRTAANGRVRRNTGMAEFLDFDAADTLRQFDANTRLSAEDYRYPTTASPDAWIWVYDGDPLDRGANKRESGSPKRIRMRSISAGSRAMPSAGRSASAESSRLRPGRNSGGYVIEILIRTPRYVMNTVRSFYRSENAPIFGLGLVAFIIGIATLMDLMRGARRA